MVRCSSFRDKKEKHCLFPVHVCTVKNAFFGTRNSCAVLVLRQKTASICTFNPLLQLTPNTQVIHNKKTVETVEKNLKILLERFCSGQGREFLSEKLLSFSLPPLECIQLSCFCQQCGECGKMRECLELKENRQHANTRMRL